MFNKQLEPTTALYSFFFGWSDHDPIGNLTMDFNHVTQWSMPVWIVVEIMVGAYDSTPTDGSLSASIDERSYQVVNWY